MRKPAALFVAAFATVAGGGLAVAVEGGPELPATPPEPSPAEIRLADDLETTTTSTTAGPTTTTTEAPSTTTTVVVVVPVPEEVAEAPAVDAPAENHGGAVSAAAHECPQQGHGQCVSEVARDHDAVAPHAERAPEEPEQNEEREERGGRGHGNGRGNGHDRGRGNGHADD